MSLEAFFRLFSGLPRQGPGSDDSTREALRRLPRLPPSPRVVDLGCGPGRQTLVLAQELRVPNRPLQARMAALQAEAATDAALAQAMASAAREIELYTRYPDAYGYVFYLLRGD